MGGGDETDDACTGSSVDGFTNVASGLDQCGTLSSNGANGELVFDNFIGITSRTSKFGIRTSTNAIVPVQCSFDSTYIANHDMSIEEGGQTSDTTANVDGQFEFDIKMMSDASMTKEFNSDRVIGDTNYITIIPKEFPTNLQYEVTKCTVSDANDGSFNILEGSCANEIVNGNILTGGISSAADYFSMEFTAFVFNTDINSEDDHHLTLSCDITVCTMDNCPMNCV